MNAVDDAANLKGNVKYKKNVTILLNKFSIKFRNSFLRKLQLF